MPDVNSIELATNALRCAAERLPAETIFRRNMLADGERIAVETEAELKALGEHDEAFSQAAAEFRRVAAALAGS